MIGVAVKQALHRFFAEVGDALLLPPRKGVGAGGPGSSTEPGKAPFGPYRAGLGCGLGQRGEGRGDPAPTIHRVEIHYRALLRSPTAVGTSNTCGREKMRGAASMRREGKEPFCAGRNGAARGTPLNPFRGSTEGTQRGCLKGSLLPFNDRDGQQYSPQQDRRSFYRLFMCKKGSTVLYCLRKRLPSGGMTCEG